MKAVQIKEKNAALTWTDVAENQPKAGEVKVRIYAAALNHRDVWIRKGMYAGLQFPVVPGSDGAGIVEEVGEGVPSQWKGKRVILNPSLQWGEKEAHQGRDYQILGMPTQGTMAEFVSISVENLHEIPEHLDFTEAAAIPLAGLTAYRALFSRANLQAGERVLISGAGGGVAQWGLQFALALGAEVVVTSGSQEKIDACIAMGAKGGANYRNESFGKDLKALGGNFDVILDSAGGSGFATLLKVAAPGGRITMYGGTRGNMDGISPQILFWKQLSILGSTMGSPKDFDAMMTFIREQKIKPTVDQIFTPEQAEEAFQRMENGDQLGKIILRIR